MGPLKRLAWAAGLALASLLMANGQARTENDGQVKYKDSGTRLYVVIKWWHDRPIYVSKREVLADFNSWKACVDCADTMNKARPMSSPWTYIAQERPVTIKFREEDPQASRFTVIQRLASGATLRSPHDSPEEA